MKCRLTSKLKVDCLEPLNTGPIYPLIYVYNIDSVERCVFKGDSRYDNNNFIEQIVSNEKYYTIDGSDITFNETYNDGKYERNLSLYFNSNSPENTLLLNDAKEHKYLVLFRSYNEPYYRVIGYKFGCNVTTEDNINNTQSDFQITFSEVSEFPTLFADLDLLRVEEKVYPKQWKLLEDFVACLLDDDGQNGYWVPQYIVRVNSAGQPLDVDGKVIWFSGKKQEAMYFDEIIPDEDKYEIVGSFSVNSVVEGIAIKQYNPDVCVKQTPNSIYTDVNEIVLWSGKNSEVINLFATDSWITNSPYILNPSEGAGDDTIIVSNPTFEDSSTIRFENLATKEISEVNVRCYYILGVQDSYSVTNDSDLVFPDNIIIGVDSFDDVTIETEVAYSTENGELTFFVNDLEPGTYPVRLTIKEWPQETKLFFITLIKSVDKEPRWVRINNYCEVVDGLQTGVQINIYRDENPNSPTYNQEKTEEKLDICRLEKPAQWIVKFQVCEVNELREKTGYVIETLKDEEPLSITYGETKEEKRYDENLCPPSPTTNYVISDDNYPTLNSVCKSFGWSSDGIGVTQDDANLITAIPDNDNYYVSKFANCSEEEINYLLQVCPNLTKIGNYVFTSIPSLTSINLRNVNTLGYGSFFNCASLTSIDLSNIVDVPYYCFSNCSKLTDVTLSDSDNLTIGGYAFYLCTDLESIDLKKTKVISESMLRQCTSLKNIIGNEVTVIDDYAFYYSSALQEVNFPKCERIGSQAFGYTYLRTFNSNSLTTLGYETFNHTNLENIDTILLTNGGQRGLEGCLNLKTIDFSNIVEGENVLYGSAVQDVILPDYSYTTVWQYNNCTPFGHINNIVNAHCKASDLTDWQAYFNGGGGQIIPVQNWITN